MRSATSFSCGDEKFLAPLHLCPCNVPSMHKGGCILDMVVITLSRV